MSPLTELIGGAKVYGWGNLLAAGAFESIASATGTGSSGTITFSSIPSTYQHLQIRGLYDDTATGGSATDMKLRFNSDTGYNYASHYLRGTGTAVAASGQTLQSVIQVESAGYSGSTANIHGVSIVDIHNYASTTQNKTVRVLSGCDVNGTDGAITLTSGLWISTSAITSITILSGSSNFATTTTFALYGIKGA